ncbi:MAG: TIGR02281 family clan AA aspartic protease [Azonexus sp.]|jgi:aspartyl protease family protein|nr:TIGR02281 family clan AA aspartic protease [Azonexus sp.]
MAKNGKSQRGLGLTALLAGLLLPASPLQAQEVALAGIFGSKAMLIINGGEPEAVRIGESLEGVKLLSIQGEQATIEIGGQKKLLRIGHYAVNVPSDGKVVLTADARGHFYATGTVNGGSIRFMVDTGATMISIGASDARRLGLDYSRGQKGMAQTANGHVEVSRIWLDTVSIGGITLHQVEAVIHKSDMPMALLGMSFLNRTDMQRVGSTMTLRQRF